MSWVAVGMAAAGMLQGAANEKKNERQNKYAAEVTRYSPWTGMQSPQVQELPGAFESALKMGATGAMIGGTFGGGDNMAGADFSKAKAISDAPQAMQNMNSWQMLDKNPYIMS